ncbi:MAG: MerR family DNA-binding transcriptional regulator, partial [Chloroflexota bacterium]
MLKIGEFSRLSQVTVKTLRYYDEIGLLKPSEIDRFTDYLY